MRKLRQWAICFLSLLYLLNVAPVYSFALTAVEESQSESTAYNLVYEYIEAVNTTDIASYIPLFTQENQTEMNSFVERFGTSDFFRDEHMEVVNLKILSEEVGARGASVSSVEMSSYDATLVLYAELFVSTLSGSGNLSSDIFEGEYAYRVFVIVEENGEWKISRVSTPEILSIYEAGESFGTENEILEMETQIDKTYFIKAETSAETVAYEVDGIYGDAEICVATPPDADPTEITVYFENDVNKNYYGVSRKTLDWTTYLKNVIPNEWIVSYYGSYPAYLQAGTMASKMYAWYYIVYPKWTSPPFYANVKDTTSDQVFVYNAYSSIGSYYQPYVDAVLSYVRNIAMCDQNGKMFEVHFNATLGTQHSGTLSASGALNLAKDGYSCYQILKYYFDYSTYIGSSNYIVLYGWA